MIVVTLYKSALGIYGFEVKNHGKSVVCAAVSVLTINAVNSVETFTNEKFSLDTDETDGYIKFMLPPENIGSDAKILLKSFELGIVSVRSQYGNDITVKVV